MDYELLTNGNVKIGQKAPDFEAETTFGEIRLEDYQGKWLVLFSHPGDFTPVCTTEMILIYPLNVGRFIPEIIRTVQALQMADCSKGSTAANWMPGQPVIVPPPKTFAELQARKEEMEKNRNGITWYLSFKQPPEKCLNQKEDCKKLEETKKEC